MKVIVNNYIPIGNRFGAINIFGILFVKRGTYITPELLNHELIHTHQIRELFFIPFYIIYVLEWMFRLFRHHFDFMQAYHAISFEREAYAHGNDLTYLSFRKVFAMWRRDNLCHR